MDLKELDIDFLVQEKPNTKQNEGAFIVNGFTVYPKGNPDQQQPPMPMVKVYLPKIAQWSISFGLVFDFTLFNIATSLTLNLNNITSSFTAAISSSDQGHLTPMITALDINVGSKSLEITNSKLFGNAATLIINAVQKVFTIIINDFGIPLSNIVFPSILQSLIQNQNLRLPISLDQVRYYDEYLINMKFSQKPLYEPDSLEFFFLGDVVYRTTKFCTVPYNTSQEYDFIQNRLLNETLNFIVTERSLNCAL